MAAPAVLTFIILSGQSDFPIYDADLTGRRENQAQQYLHQFVLHAALDALDDAAWQQGPSSLASALSSRGGGGGGGGANAGDCYLRQVDRFNALAVSGYVTPGGARMLLLHDGGGGGSRPPAEESVRSFFLEVHDAYVRAALNPLQAPGARLVPSRAFDARVWAAARRALGSPA